MEALGIVALAIFGLVMGSAVTALAHRVPRGQSWIHGRSACPNCGTQLTPRDLVPVFSFLLSRGRCRHCGHPIAWRYPLTEILCAAWTALLGVHVGFTLALPWIAIWGYLMIALMWIDLDYQLLPDVLTFPGTLVALIAAMMIPGGVREGLFGMLIGSGTLWLLAWGYLRIRKVEGMGGGDIKLAAMFGLLLGWKLTLLTLMMAALAGSIWGGLLMLRRQGDGQTALPFGTLLAPASMIVFLWGPTWVESYTRWIRGL